VGFRVVDLISREWGIRLGERRAKAVLGEGYHGGQQVILAKPRTFMNNSGEGVAYLLTRFGAKPGNLLVVYDEMALPTGKLRLRPEGSDAGHNGMRSIIQSVGTTAFPRLRVGIGPPQGPDSVSHVLGRFSDEEKETIDEAVRQAVAATACMAEEDIDTAMSRFN
jgi:PTH1 family peptidyl-tRNA hydrolase